MATFTVAPAVGLRQRAAAASQAIEVGEGEHTRHAGKPRGGVGPMARIRA
jgi:hypothetical protein